MRSSASAPPAPARRVPDPFHGSPKWKPSGIPVVVVCDHGAVVSTGFPPPAAGWGPAAPAKYAPERMLPVGWLGCGSLAGVHNSRDEQRAAAKEKPLPLLATLLPILVERRTGDDDDRKQHADHQDKQVKFPWIHFHLLLGAKNQ